ncbi:hypothetical protein VFPPC_04966 [Pochonia chlamydosporia 170]|uniref:Rhodopsin domain-containing protein n=1 Tax=Pochonia chlamydosporia 170 TaxID=1380566 RepID=A0A179FTU2_METCM|nr:hypothetical protein VFPPC_04966 [Pochonia chlamydosporia 170]OAQ68777.1 hypothetical protein VFPPC_04966 [Pochonia chlamydosporia 170]
MGPRGMGFPADGKDNNGWKLYISSLVLIIVAGLTVIARCVTRLWLNKPGWDDAVIVLSLCFSIIVSVSMQLAIEYGYGMHKDDLSKADLRTALRFFFIAQTPYKVAVWLNKLSVILLYLRIFISRSFRISAYVVMGIVTASSIGGIGATIWQCVPISAAWDKTVKATCIDSDKFWVAYAVMNVLTDAMVLALPIPSILQLQLSWKNRIMLCCMFLLGSFVTVTSILRTTSVSNSLEKKADITYNFIDRGIWTLTETNLGIISACLLVLKQPLGKLFPRLFGSTKKASSYYPNNSLGRNAGYNLSDLHGPNSESSGVWRNQGRFKNETTISGPGESRKESDEDYIIEGYKVGNNSHQDILAGHRENR